MDHVKEQAIARFAEAWREGSSDPIGAVVDPSIVMDWSNSVGPLRGTYRGVDAVRRAFESFREAFSDVHWQAHDPEPFGDDRIVMGTSVAVHGRDSGVETTARGAQVWTFSGHRVTAVKLFQSRPEALLWLRRDRLERARVYFVCEGLVAGHDTHELLDAVLSGGADIVQLREKAPRCAEEVVSLAEPFRRAAGAHGALFILNDLPDLVEACGADGVHVGQDDMAVAAARAAAGPAALVGLSTHSAEQVDAACSAPTEARPDQISVGPVWETPTKEGRPATGLGLIGHAAANATLPWFAIGGIDTSNVAEVVAAGAERIVVVRAIRDADDPQAAARTLRRALNGPIAPKVGAEEAVGRGG